MMPWDRQTVANQIAMYLHRALAHAELRAPLPARSAFIPAGNAFDAMVAVGKVLGGTTLDVLIVDPYMDEKALTDFAPLAPDRVAIRLLADEDSHKRLSPPLRVGPHSTARDL
jgi:hypothetical protein